jgi:hypothetical protein
MLLMMPLAILALLAAALPAFPADADVATHIEKTAKSSETGDRL